MALAAAALSAGAASLPAAGVSLGSARTGAAPVAASAPAAGLAPTVGLALAAASALVAGLRCRRVRAGDRLALTAASALAGASPLTDRASRLGRSHSGWRRPPGWRGAGRPVDRAPTPSSEATTSAASPIGPAPLSLRAAGPRWPRR